MAILTVLLVCCLLASGVGTPAAAQTTVVVSATAGAAQTDITFPFQGKYWAGGDSIASGNGSQKPYGFNSANNRCNRSPGAYAPLLASAQSLQLTFVACAGAKITDVIHGMKTERGQFDTLSSATALATITVGGNDVEQGAFALRCVMPFGSCDQNSSEYKRTMGLIRDVLPDRLQDAFRIMARQAPNATILVVGYPQLIVPPGNACTYFVDSEKAAVRSVIGGLNNALQAAVQQVNNTTGGGRFKFVDPNATGSPWLGHELCSANSYVNGFSPFNNEDSFHPNVPGQKAYYKLIENQLQAA